MSSLISNSIARVIQHKCVGKPTYLDVLPGDVLQYCIMPYLGWEDRIHVNMLTPAGDRTLPNKIPKEQIIAHNLNLITQKLTRQARKSTTLQTMIAYHTSRGIHGGPSKIKVIQEIIKFLQSVQESQNIMLLQFNSAYRDRITSKIIEFSNPAAVANIPRIYLRQQLAETLSKLTEILVSHPFIKEVTPKKYLSALVWQNETAVLNEWWVPGKGVVGRYLGDIYTQME